MIRIVVQEADFDANAEYARLADASAGAIASFIGIVRAGAGARAVTAMTLEHYPGLTETALRKIAKHASTNWPLTGCTIIHRIGRLRPGDNIVLAAAASPHRKAALQATEFLIDHLKTAAPFWKREDFSDGTSEWVAASDADENVERLSEYPTP
jgi:molybdopterin synthase catalytic subunit